MADSTTKKIAVVTGSTRAVRVGPAVTKFVTAALEADLSSQTTGTKFKLSNVDIGAFILPIFDEAVIPAAIPMAGQFQNEHSKNWSAEIAKYDGYVFITACYNEGLPGAIKNALDYLYHEVAGKPFLIISYGVSGGRAASDSLKTTLQAMRAHVVDTRPTLPFSRNGPVEFGRPLDMREAAVGKLGDLSLKEWEEAKKPDILKGFGELKEYLVKAA